MQVIDVKTIEKRIVSCFLDCFGSVKVEVKGLLMLSGNNMFSVSLPFDEVYIEDLQCVQQNIKNIDPELNIVAVYAQQYESAVRGVSLGVVISKKNFCNDSTVRYVIEANKGDITAVLRSLLFSNVSVEADTAEIDINTGKNMIRLCILDSFKIIGYEITAIYADKSKSGEEEVVHLVFEPVK